MNIFYCWNKEVVSPLLETHDTGVLAGSVKMIDIMCDTFGLLEQIISEFFCNGDNIILSVVNCREVI